MPRITTPDDYYWATETPENIEELVGYLNDRTEAFLDIFSNTFVASRIARNWRYYHNLFYTNQGSYNDTELRMVGREGEYVGLSVPHFRSLIQQMLILTTQQRPSWDVRAINTEPKSLQQAKIAGPVLDYYMTFKKVEDKMRRAVEHALIFNVGYVLSLWDQQADAGGGSNGDIQYHTPTVFDVAYDLTAKNWDEVEWVRVRLPENKWNLVARHPELKDRILEEAESGLDETGEYTIWGYDAKELGQDKTDVWHWFHKRTEALPEGRYVESIGELPLYDGPMPYQDLPIDRIVAGEHLLTCLGHSPANDIQALQESLNAEASTIVTNHAHLGVGNLWVESGDDLNEEQLRCGLNLLRSQTKPEPLELVQTPKEILDQPDIMAKWMEILTGINSVARGNPEASLKSGTALAVIDAKAQQAMSYLQSQYYQALEGVGTKTIRYLSQFGGPSERIISIAGKFNRQYVSSFSPDSLQLVDRVLVQAGNVLSRSLSGRVQIAENLLQTGFIKTPEEYFNVLNTGQLDSLMEADMNELALIREESEALLELKVIVASPADHHILHIREHHSILGSVAMRQDPQIVKHVEGHIMEHITFLRTPGIIEIQAALGYQIPPIPMSMGPPGAPQGPGGPPGGAPSPNPEGNPTGRPEANAPPVKPPSPPKVPSVEAA